MLHLAWTLAVAPPSEVPEEWLLDKGAAEVAKIIAAELGDRVVLRGPVFKIDQDSEGVIVTYSDCKTIQAKTVVVAIRL